MIAESYGPILSRAVGSVPGKDGYPPWHAQSGRTRLVRDSQEDEDKLSTPKRVPSIEDQRQFWDWHWQHWEDRKVLNAWTERRAQEILRLIQQLPLKQPRILDLGCGRGWFTERLADLGEAHGIDLSPEGVATIAHVEDQPKYVTLAAEVLKAGGYFIITTGNKFVMDRLGDVGWNVQPPQHIANQLSRGQLKQMLAARYKVLKSLTIIPHGKLGVLRLINSYKLNLVARILLSQQKIDELKEKAGFGWQMILVAQKKA